MKNILICIRSAPHGQHQGPAALDVLLTAAAFEHSVSLLLLDDGVYQLKNQQAPHTSIGLKNTGAIYKSLALYDIENVYVKAESLSARQLTLTDLLIPVELITASAISTLLNQQDVILNF